MKQIIIAGGLTRDATLRRTQAGDPILGFSVGVSEGRDKPSTYFDCSLFGKRGEALEQYLKKGAKVTVIGDFSTREHEGKTYLQVRVSEVSLQGGKRDDAPRDDDRGQDPSGYQDRRGGAPAGGMDDEIPFAPWVL
jgi:single-strand DNA-binding protein